MAIKQLSVFVDNKKGALSDITTFLAKQGIDLRAMSIADTQDFGILRLSVNDTERAAALLRETEAIAKVTDVIAVALTDEPGGRAKVLEVLAAPVLACLQCRIWGLLMMRWRSISPAAP